MLAVLAATLWAGDADTFLLRNVDVYLGAGPDVKGGSILVVNGKIADIGPKVTAAKGVRVVDGKGLRA